MQRHASAGTAREGWDVSRYRDGGASGRGGARLWRAVRPELGGSGHEVGPGALGEYALLMHTHGRVEAARVLPAVATHLASGCTSCGERLEGLSCLIAADPGSVGAGPPDPDSAAPGQPC